jgi:hypothetical protein
VRRWEHEALLEAMQDRLDHAPEMMRNTPPNGGASVRHDQGLDGRDALLDPHTPTGEHGDESSRARLQPQARDESLGDRCLDPGHQGEEDLFAFNSFSF